MDYHGTVTLHTPSGEKLTWEVRSAVSMENGICTFMQEDEGMHMRVQLMGTIVCEVYETASR